MKSGTKVLTALLFGGVLAGPLAAGVSPARAETAEQRQDCTKYYFQWCSHLGFDRAKIAVCLRQHASEMAPGACKASFENGKGKH